MSASRALPPRLLAISPGDLEDSSTGRFIASASAASAAGLCGLVLREKRLSDRPFLELARALRPLFSWLAIHDRAHLAEVLEAEAVHLGHRSLAPTEVRRWLSQRIALGLSTHARDDEATWSAADYLFHGPVFETPSKIGLAPTIGLEGLARATQRSPKPIWAIGGIDAERARACVGAGARGVAVLSRVFGAPDVASAVRGFLAAQSVPGERPER